MKRPKTRALLGLAVWWVASAGAEAGTEIQVLAMHPGGAEVTLATHQKFYLRIGYATDAPVRIWARPHFQGAEVRAGSHPSAVYTGRGEALGWFFVMDPGARVDEVRITASDGTASGTRLVMSQPVRIVAAERAAPAAPEPAWVSDLRRESERALLEADEQRSSTPPSAGETALVGGFMLVVLALGVAGIAAPSWALLRWRGGWRAAAAVPAAMVAFVVLRVVFDTARDPTSHNLWPFEILQIGLLSIVAVGLLAAARKFQAART